MSSTAVATPVHGGLDSPVNRIDSAAVQEGLATICVNEVDRTTLYRIADGTLSPLTGPMGKADYDSVLGQACIERGGKNWAWTIPIILPLSDAEAGACTAGAKVSLVDEAGKAFGEGNQPTLVGNANERSSHGKHEYTWLNEIEELVD